MTGQEQEPIEAVRDANFALREQLESRVDQLRDTLATLNQRALRIMRLRPGACLACAVAAGFLLGRLASRR